MERLPAAPEKEDTVNEDQKKRLLAYQEKLRVRKESGR